MYGVVVAHTLLQLLDSLLQSQLPTMRPFFGTECEGIDVKKEFLGQQALLFQPGDNRSFRRGQLNRFSDRLLDLLFALRLIGTCFSGSMHRRIVIVL